MINAYLTEIEITRKLRMPDNIGCLAVETWKAAPSHRCSGKAAATASARPVSRSRSAISTSSRLSSSGRVSGAGHHQPRPRPHSLAGLKDQTNVS
jgi:hypothetical protein